MKYLIAVRTDVGIQKETNQDSCCIKVAETKYGQVVMSVLCDGMGGLSKGEVASATLIAAFCNWFDNELGTILSAKDAIDEAKSRWERIIKEQNQIIGAYGRSEHIQLGSTITAQLILYDGSYLIGHVGDSRAYCITNSSITQLTEDQTVVAREVKQGKLTPEKAETDPRRNVLLQCVGASKSVFPEFYYGKVSPQECYMLCSDGFRHLVTSDEIQYTFAPRNNTTEATMERNIEKLIDLNKYRHESDNITALLIKTDQEE